MSKVSKVVLGNETIMDITDSTVNENNLLDGEVGYGSDGERVVGRAVIPTVNDGVLTIQKNGTTVQTFSANQNTDVTVDITVPTTAADVGAIPTTQKGVASGVAELDATGKVPSSQLPSFVDDTVEGYLYEGHWYSDAQHTQEVVGETGKIYVELSTNKTYRWSGTTFVEISESVALGETSSTAYRGDRGATAYSHAIDANKVSSATATGLYKVGATAEGHISELQAVQKSDITNLGIPGSVPDIVDNLNSTDATKTLSAKQGKVLKDAIDAKSSVLILTITQDEQTGDLVCDKLPSEVTAAYSNGTVIQAKALLGEELTLSLIYAQDRSFFFGTSALSIEEGGIVSIGLNLLKDSSNDAWESIDFYDDRVTNPKIATISKNGNVYSCDLTPDEIDYAINFCAGIVLHYSENGVIYNFTLVGYEDKYVFATTVPTLDETGTLTKMFILDPSSQGWNDITFIEYNSSNDPNAIKWSEASTSVKKNWLPNNAISQTVNGVTFTVNADKSVTVNGTATADAMFNLCPTPGFENDIGRGDNKSTLYLASGSYLFTNATSTSITSGVRLILNNVNGVAQWVDADNTTVRTITAPEHPITVGINVASGTVVSNLTLYPMIRLASIENDTYTPYIPDNTELVSWSDSNKSVKKNFLNLTCTSTTIVGVTFTVNTDKTVTVNGTRTSAGESKFYFYNKNSLFLVAGETYIASIGHKNESSNITEFIIKFYNGDTVVGQFQINIYKENVVFTVPSNANQVECYYYFAGNGTSINNVTLKPMIRLASVIDSTYTPYIPDNTELVSYADNNVLGAKNLLENTAISQTINGVTFTVNSDKSVTVNGTATAETWFTLKRDLRYLKKDRYILSGCPTNGSIGTYMLIFVIRNATDTADELSILDFGESANFSVPEDNRRIPGYIVIKKDVTVSNLVFKPMIRLATDTDDTYVPYAKTNRELTECTQNIDYYEQKGFVGKNILKLNGSRNINGTSNGVTFTYNDDTGIVTANGTPTASVFRTLANYVRFNKDTTVRLAGCPTGGNNKYYLGLYDGTNYVAIDYGYGAQATVSRNKIYSVFFNILSDASALSNIQIKPILSEDLSVTYDKFVPYFPESNRVVSLRNLDILGSKNLMPNYGFSQYTTNGVTFTKNSDGSILIDGTNSKDDWSTKYILGIFKLSPGLYCVSQGPTTGSSRTNFIRLKNGHGNGSTILELGDNDKAIFRLDSDTDVYADIQIRPNAVISNAIMYPMIRIHDVESDNFVEFAKTNQELTEDIGRIYNELGGKNLLPVTDIPTVTSNGITYTVNSDGSISLSGTATATEMRVISTITLEPGTYRLSGIPYNINGGYSKIQIHTEDVSTGTSLNWASRGTDGSAEIKTLDTTTTLKAYLDIYSGYNVTGITVYPMIRLASVEDSTFVPYAQTNRQLTNGKVDWKSNSILGAKNLLEGRFLTTTVNGVTFTEQNDRTVIISSSGDTQNANLTSEVFTLNKGSYYLGKNVSSSIGGTRIAILVNNSVYQNIIGYDEWIPFTITSDINCTVRLYVPAHTGAISNVKFEPMIRLIADSDSTYQLFAMTNRQLTEEVQKLSFYLDQTATTSTSTDTVYTFTDSRITSNSAIDVYADIFGVSPSNVVTTNGSCTVTFPKQSTAQSMTCRIYIK